MTETEYCYETPFGIDVLSVSIDARPRVATLTIQHRDVTSVLIFENPSPISSFAGLFEDLERIRISDRNFYGSQLAFGRYDVQMWDEDTPYASFDCDNFQADGAV
ncbi:hypothetical protein [Aureliella helgolandensis]|uniref:Uncharacterized protein n=1 Tax=Aureliella helgolandensis TaxID=2527968 RepID=A0A518G2T9_9BACT|nr:hypothetical protein [Aureliella helgolandensis]QDV22902.1 hypothetical protein Q31a_11950 [Aureliella helgolandensis]